MARRAQAPARGEASMEIVLAAVVAAAVAGIVVVAGNRRGPAAAAAGHAPTPDASREAAETSAPAPEQAPLTQATATAAAAPAVAPGRLAAADDGELRARRAEIARIEERLLSKEESLGVRLGELERKERSLEDRTRNLEHQAERLKEAKQDHVRELERLSGLSASQARQLLLRELEDKLRHDRAVLARQIEDEVRHDAERRARSILATAMQRIASGHAAETTVSVVQLPSDELKGRIIGREGRNIRTLETLTGVDFIIDDTPSAVLLSAFDGVRRETAKLTLEKLLADGRIHPARIEEMYYQAKAEMEVHIAHVGEEAALEANAGQIHPELTKLLGRLHYRTSYGKNVLAHSIEWANLAGMIAHVL